MQVAELGSLTKAAALRNKAQPLLSRQITLLEQSCGERLFERTGRGVTLTEAGKRVLPRVKSWLSEGDQIVADVRAVAGVPMGVVRVGVLSSTSPMLVGMLFQRVRKQFPGIQLRIVESSSGQLAEWLRTGQIEIAVLFRSDREGGPDDHPVSAVKTLLVSCAGDPVTASPTIAFDALDGLPLVLLPETNHLRRMVQQAADERRVNLNVVMECDSIAAQKAAVALGGAYTVLGENAVIEELNSGRLQASRIVAPSIQRILTISLSSHRQSTLACKEVAALVENCLLTHMRRP
ncbi:LysR family transcriptional regulator [Lacisediminimonas profundi]|uniref:LysR family transcriptional regulator n=1 Tax=Lacisediminimonas profundi TaxID=2603856 RepID=UPI0013873C1E|nr:LysR family transcriptional regulator [Lacisediminimonas profundi]